jgi:hypothetical protein
VSLGVLLNTIQKYLPRHFFTAHTNTFERNHPFSLNAFNLTGVSVEKHLSFERKAIPVVAILEK